MLALPPHLIPLITAFLAAGGAGGVIVLLVYAHLTRNAVRDKRIAAIAGAGTSFSGGFGSRQAVGDEALRKKSIEDTLKTLAEKQKVKNGGRLSLKGRLGQAGLGWSATRYYATSVICAVIAFLLTAAFGIGLLPSLGFAIALGLLLPHLYVGHRRARRLKKFTAEFPNSVDVIVRGVKAGLPLADCLRIISTEAQEPVRSEFRRILEDQTMGIPIEQAVQGLAERIPLAEANFFAIVIALQTSTGGSLSETLGNLSKVIRERKKMQAKVKSMSSEAKSSAAIIGSLPVVVAILLYVVSPGFISPLFVTTIGKIVLVACLIWMGIGVLVMRKIINFDF